MKSIKKALSFFIALVMVFSVFSAVALAEDEKYTYDVQNEKFSKYNYKASGDKNTDMSKQGWTLSGSTDTPVVRYSIEESNSFIHIANDGNRTMYLAKSYKVAIKEKAIVSFDARYIKGSLSISLSTSGKPQDSPKSFASMTLESGTITFNGQQIKGIVAKKWYTYTITCDLVTGKASLLVKGEGIDNSINDVAIGEVTGTQKISQFIISPSAGGSIDFTNYSMGYKDKNVESIGKVKIFQANQKTIEETKKLIDNQPNTLRKMEYLDRGLVAVKTQTGVFLSWRWLGTESVDVTFNLYRDGTKINALPLTVTNFTDNSGALNSKYEVAAIADGVEQAKEAMFKTMLTDNGLEIKMQPPAPWKDDRTIDKATGAPTGKEHKYFPGDTNLADLDGDGQLEIVIMFSSVGADSSHGGFTSPQVLQAYKLDGTKMWEINIGRNIRSGAHYEAFSLADLDGDGKAELMTKTADGTMDNAGKYVGDPKADYRNSMGWVLAGPEYLTVFNGEKGTIIDTVNYPTPRGPSDTWQAVWGDSYGNRQDRYHSLMAWLDGVNPSIIMCRGYYTRTTLAAYDLKGGKLVQRWYFDSHDGKDNNIDYAGRGNHSVGVLDVDFDGKDEIIYGASSYDDNGKGLYTMKSLGLGHGDAQHSGDLIPSRPGLEVFQVHEGGTYGVTMRDARTGELIWSVPMNGGDIGRGISADVDPRYDGAESWGAGGYITADGSVNKMDGLTSSHLIWWDGDLGRELQNSTTIYKPNIQKNKTDLIFSAKGYVHINGTKSTPMITSDIFGDWREETIYPYADGSKIKIFTTTIPTEYRMYTLLHDGAYRAAIDWQHTGYNQPTYMGFNFSYTTKEIPVPKIIVEKDGKQVTNPDLTKTKAYPIENLKSGSVVQLMINDEKAIVNDSVVRIDSSIEGVAPIVDNGRTIIPVRFVSDAFGSKVDWDEPTKTITISLGDKTIKMALDSNDYTINGEAKKLEVPAKSINGRTFIPLRAMVEALGKEVFWDNRGYIYISDKKVEFTQDQSTMLINSIKSVPVPPIKKEAQIISGSKLLEEQISIVSVTSNGSDGNNDQNAVDGDFTTRWSHAENPAILEVQLVSEKLVKGVAVAHWSGNRTYTFDVETSVDGKTWVNQLASEKSSGEGAESDLEMHIFKAPVKAKYVRIKGFGSNANSFTHVSELVVLESK